MFAKIKQMIANLEDISKSPDKCADRDTLVSLAYMKEADIGKLFLAMSREKIDFSRVENKDVPTDGYVQLVRDASTMAEKMFYTLKYVGNFHRITKKTVDKILRTNGR